MRCYMSVNSNFDGTTYSSVLCRDIRVADRGATPEQYIRRAMRRAGLRRSNLRLCQDTTERAHVVAQVCESMAVVHLRIVACAGAPEPKCGGAQVRRCSRGRCRVRGCSRARCRVRGWAGTQRANTRCWVRDPGFGVCGCAGARVPGAGCQVRRSVCRRSSRYVSRETGPAHVPQ